MTFEAALYSHLMADATITDVVGDRIHPMFFPEPEHSDIQEVQPFIVTQLDGEATVEHSIDNEEVHAIERWALYACSGRHDEMLSLAAALKTSLDAFNGLLGGASGVRANVSLEAYSDDASFDLGLYVRRLVFTATHEL